MRRVVSGRRLWRLKSVSNKTVPTEIFIGLSELDIEQYLLHITEETVFHIKTVSFTFL
jgi:hypothetical protein